MLRPLPNNETQRLPIEDDDDDNHNNVSIIMAPYPYMNLWHFHLNRFVFKHWVSGHILECVHLISSYYEKERIASLSGYSEVPMIK